MNWVKRVSSLLNLIDNLVNFTYFDAVDFIKTREDLNEIVNGNVQLSPLTNFDQYNYDGLQPLHYAIKGRKAFAVEWLLSHENIPLNSLTENENWNSAHCAVIVGDWETLNKLIQAGANLNSVDSYLLTPLAYAKSDLNAEIWLQYLDEINPINFNIRLGPLKRNYFHYFARDSTKVLLNYVIKMNIDEINYADVTGTTPLMLAAETGQNESLWILLSNGALLNCIDSEGRSALHRAAAFGQSKACQLLLYDSEMIPTDQIIDNNEFTEIYDFSTRADEAQELLLAQDNSDLTPLMTAIISGNIETVRILAKYYSNHLDLKERHKGETALHLAVSVNSAEMVSILLEAGAYPDALNNFGMKPSDLCAKDSDIFDLLAII